MADGCKRTLDVDEPDLDLIAPEPYTLDVEPALLTLEAADPMLTIEEPTRCQ